MVALKSLGEPKQYCYFKWYLNKTARLEHVPFSLEQGKKGPWLFRVFLRDDIFLPSYISGLLNESHEISGSMGPSYQPKFPEAKVTGGGWIFLISTSKVTHPQKNDSVIIRVIVIVEIHFKQQQKQNS